MSIYINGFDIPQDGIVRVIMIESDGSVRFYGGSSVIARAVQLPPCGRLGDLDNLERMFSDIANAPYSGFDGEEPFYSADDAAQIIRLAPTIIPADREGAEAALKEANDG